MIERMGSVIDMIVGCPSRSVTRSDFFRFQRDWDALNQEFGFRFCGALWLMTAAGKHAGDSPFEIYVAGAKRHGDSIGRPSRHRRKNGRPTTPPKEPAPLPLAEGLQGRVMRLNQPRVSLEEMDESYWLPRSL